MKYKTLAELVQAFKAGELPGCEVLVDKHDCWVFQDDVWVFKSGGPDELIGQALDLLGIPWTRF